MADGVRSGVGSDEGMTLLDGTIIRDDNSVSISALFDICKAVLAVAV